MQQGASGGGGGGGATATTTTTAAQMPVESASPISSRPPASTNLEELMRLSEEADRGGGGGLGIGGGGGCSSGGNRWPSQETLALLKIRSEMDAVFRDATVKGPLWEDVSRQLAELGYKRSAKKCKEKFENVHKYYKRTKEGRAGRQDGKSYKFFTQLEALHSTTSNVPSTLPMPVTTTTVNAAAVTLDVAPVSIGIPMPISSSLRIPSSSTLPMFPPDPPTAIPGSSTTPVTTTSVPLGISFSSDSSSSSPETEDDDDDDEMGFEAGSSRKRKRRRASSSHRMMDFFESLMKQVMQKQEAMQQRFLEVIEKREQERMMRDEAWKRQEMARLAHEHELMAQERAISASRDSAIISFLQKVTGQTIQLPTATPPPSQPTAPPPPPPQVPHVVVAPAVAVHVPSSSLPQAQSGGHHQQQQVVVQHQPTSTSIAGSDAVMAIPEQQIAPQEMGLEGSSSSSRWPKPEVLALIKLRSGLEPRYQEAGPKGPLWEEISTGMSRMGYKRSAKRCKEKWENINKYFKRVKESNKKRPEDSKTCPYFHELDVLYRKKIIGNTSSLQGQQPQQETINLDPIPTTNPQESSSNVNVPAAIMPPAPLSENKNEASVDAQPSNLGLPEGNGGASNKPEDIVKEFMNQQGMQQQQQASLVDNFDKIEEARMDSDSDNMDQDEDDEDDEDDDEEEELEGERKMAYKVEFQQQNTKATNNGGTGNGAPSFFAMVQ